METKAGVDPILTRGSVERTGAMYLAGQDPLQPLLSPAVVADLTGLPPLLIQVGTNEILLDDSTRLAARVTAARVDVILDITADVPHVFQSFADGPLDEADQALDRPALFINQHIPTTSTATAAAPAGVGGSQAVWTGSAHVDGQQASGHGTKCVVAPKKRQAETRCEVTRKLVSCLAPAVAPVSR